MKGQIALSYAVWVMAGLTVLLLVGLLIRGRVRIEKGWAGFTVMRFNGFERFTHWTLAVSALVLALTGIAISNEQLLTPLVAQHVHVELLQLAKSLHRALAFGFMASLMLAFVLWAPYSFPHWRDLVWLLKGGGILKGTHPPTWRLSVSQKILFWLTILNGVLLSLSGLALLGWNGPFFSTITLLTALGLPASGAATQDAATWHSFAALTLIWSAILHIFVRTAGIQGAFSAMASGQVDANWARQHHRLWAERELKRMDGVAAQEPKEGHVVPAE